MSDEVNVNREYKSRLFVKLFSDKKELLDLYNAVNGTEYDNPDDIDLNTVEDFIYMGMKNDISFLITDVLNLYEHQSTVNPNMPFRGFLYFAALYRKLFKEQNDIYSSKLIMIPTPQFIVFYNGTTDEPDRMELRLSDAFSKKKVLEPCIECTATLLNINYGHNRKLMEKCKTLREYATLVFYVREELSKRESNSKEARRAAIDAAIDRCIIEGILAEFLREHRREATDMLLTEYDEALHIKNEKEISYGEGMKQGVKQGIKQGVQLVNELYSWLVECGRSEDITKAIDDASTLDKLLNEYQAYKNGSNK